LLTSLQGWTEQTSLNAMQTTTMVTWNFQNQVTFKK